MRRLAALLAAGALVLTACGPADQDDDGGSAGAAATAQATADAPSDEATDDAAGQLAGALNGTLGNAFNLPLPVVGFEQALGQQLAATAGLVLHLRTETLITTTTTTNVLASVGALSDSSRSDGSMPAVRRPVRMPLAR